MKQDDDVEKLFSWLQTPEIRYREFAGAREVTDAVVTVQQHTNTPQIDPPAPHNTQLDEEYPADQFPDQSQTVVEIEPAANGSTPSPAVHHEAVRPPPIPAPTQPAPSGSADRASPGSAPAPASADPNDHAPRPLDSVFNRLSGARTSTRAPRERVSRIPGSGSSNGRPR
jgi:hypothetical protein